MIYIPTTSATVAPPRSRGPSPTDKAEALLKSWLSEKQLKDYKRHGWFEVVGNATGQRYRIMCKYTVSNVCLICDGKVNGSLCVVPQGSQIPSDVFLAQKVALEKDELATLRRANGPRRAVAALVALAIHGPKCFEDGDC